MTEIRTATPQSDLRAQLPDILAAVAAKTTNSIVVTDTNGLIEWVNVGFTRLTGYLPEEVRGKHPETLLKGQQTSSVAQKAIREATAAGSAFDAVILNYSKSGRPYWVHIDAEPRTKGGEVVGHISIQTDVTHTRIAEAREGVLQAVGRRLMHASTIEEGASIILDELVSISDIQAACLWLVHDDNTGLSFVAGCSASDEASCWVDRTKATSFRRGTELTADVGAPGLAWGTTKPSTIHDFQPGHPGS
jgi:PAS domain S-box-containing protein